MILLDQLSFGGKMIIPLGSERDSQKLTIVNKMKNGEVILDPKLDVVYVPLTSISKQLA